MMMEITSVEISSDPSVGVMMEARVHVVNTVRPDQDLQAEVTDETTVAAEEVVEVTVEETVVTEVGTDIRHPEGIPTCLLLTNA